MRGIARLAGLVVAAASCFEGLRAEEAGGAFELAGAVENPRTYTPADLRREPVTTETVFFSTGKGPVRASFTGVLLWTLLEEAGIRTDPAIKNDILRHTVTVVGADGYTAVLAAGELDPEFGGELAIIAYAQDGAPLPAARLIVPGDQAGGRDVAGIARIEVR